MDNNNSIIWVNISKLEVYQDNPRNIHKREFEELVESIKADPKFLIIRCPLVNKVDGKYIIYAGSQRFRAARELGYEEIPVIVDENLSDEIMRQRCLKDNHHAGKWSQDVLANKWDFEELKKVGKSLLKQAKVPNLDKKDVGRELIKDKDIEKNKMMAGYGTSVDRNDVSVPVKFLEHKKLLIGDVLDYGCGQEMHEYTGFDPYYAPDYTLLQRQYDTIMCNYVLNVLPLVHNRFELVRTVYSLLRQRGIAYFSVFIKQKEDSKSNKGFQSGWTEPKWLEWMASIYPTEKIQCNGVVMFKIDKL